MINKILIIGIGLIGGSLALALKKTGVCGQIKGYGRNQIDLQRAVQLGVIDGYEMDLPLAAQDADIIVLATPVGVMETLLWEIAPCLSSHTIITDVGSTKASVVAAVRRVFGQVPSLFVPGHPIAGTEQSGVEAAFPELFQGRRVVLTPLPETDPRAVATVRQMWEWAGAEVVETHVGHHDEILAATSHLPHLLAYTLVDTLARRDSGEEIFGFAAGGFRDFTRIAASNPQMWHDICLANSDAIIAILELFKGDLERLADMLRAGDGIALLDIFSRAKAARDRYAATLGV